MDRFLMQRNIERYRKLADEATTLEDKRKLLSLLAQEQTELKRDLRKVCKDRPIQPSASSPASLS